MRTVAAPPERIFALLADPAKHPLIDGSGTVVSSRDAGQQRLELGSRFGMDMKVGISYRITNKVVEYEEGRLIAWRHFAGHRWRWQLTPSDEGTEVTESFDWSRAPAGLFYPLAGVPEKNRKAIEGTLKRLEQVVTRPE